MINISLHSDPYVFCFDTNRHISVAPGGPSFELELVLALALIKFSTSTSLAPHSIAFSQPVIKLNQTMNLTMNFTKVPKFLVPLLHLHINNCVQHRLVLHCQLHRSALKSRKCPVLKQSFNQSYIKKLLLQYIKNILLNYIKR